MGLGLIVLTGEAVGTDRVGIDWLGNTQSAGIGVKAWGPSSHGIGGVGDWLGVSDGGTTETVGVAFAAVQPESARHMTATAVASRRLVLPGVECTRMVSLPPALTS